MFAGFAWVALTYIIASIPFGLVLTTLYGGAIDLRSAGSGNTGATNVGRVFGWKLAGWTLVLDAGKGALPTLGALWLWPETTVYWPASVALVAFIGHCFSMFLEFRGGKGVATAAGAMAVLLPVPTLLAIVMWGLVLRLTGRSSVAALTASIALVGWVWWLAPHLLGVVVVLALGIVFTHAPNIRRLLAGEEKQVVRPVRMGKPTTIDAGRLMEQSPAGRSDAPPVWKERAEVSAPVSAEEGA